MQALPDFETISPFGQQEQSRINNRGSNDDFENPSKTDIRARYSNNHLVDQGNEKMKRDK